MQPAAADTLAQVFAGDVSLCVNSASPTTLASKKGPRRMRVQSEVVGFVLYEQPTLPLPRGVAGIGSAFDAYCMCILRACWTSTFTSHAQKFHYCLLQECLEKEIEHSCNGRCCLLKRTRQAKPLKCTQYRSFCNFTFA